LQPLCLPASRRCTGGFLQGASVAGELPGFFLEDLVAVEEAVGLGAKIVDDEVAL